MAEIATISTDLPTAVTLGSVVVMDGVRGVVWHATRDTLRILPIIRGRTAVRLSMANEVSLRLPVSLGGWSIAYDELLSWPRELCYVIGELDVRCLLRILDARRIEALPLSPAFVSDRLFAANRQAVAH
jgi:hypothetical protein